MKRLQPCAALLTLMLVGCGSAVVGAGADEEAAALHGGELLTHYSYDGMAGLTDVSPPWQGQQTPTPIHMDQRCDAGTPRLIVTADVPGTLDQEFRPDEGVNVLHFRLCAADRTITGDGASRSRAEVHGRHQVGDGGWPDPPGSIRWYGFSLYVPKDYVGGGVGQWFVFSQWHDGVGESPPLTMEIHDDNFILAGAGAHRPTRVLGPIKRGEWARFEVGVHWSPLYVEGTDGGTEPDEGWVHAFFNGAEVVNEPRSTLNLFPDGRVSPVSFKQGIYRRNSWDTDVALYLGPTRVGTSRRAVQAP